MAAVGEGGQLGPGPEVAPGHVEAGALEQVGDQLADLAQPQHPDPLDRHSVVLSSFCVRVRPFAASARTRFDLDRQSV